jgi:hypothetical protein
MLPPATSLPGRLRNAGRRTAAALLGASVLALHLPGTPADAAGLWKCRGPDSVPMYQDRPCDSGAELRDLVANPPPLSVIPLVPPDASRPAARPPPRRAEKPPPRRAEPPARSRRGDAARVIGDAAERRHVHEGLGEGEVLARLGSPDLASGKGGRRMRWTYLPAPGDPQTLTTVRFEDGRVIGVERTIVR